MLTCAAPFDVGRPRFERRRGANGCSLQLGGVFDRDDALVVGNEVRQHVEERRLAGAGAAGDDDVLALLDADLEKRRHRCRQRAVADQVVGVELASCELADGQRRALERERRDDRVDARAVFQPRVDHRRRLVDAAAERRDDALDDAHHGAIARKRCTVLHKATEALDVDLVEAIDHDLGHSFVGEQVFERAQVQRPRSALHAAAPRDRCPGRQLRLAAH